MSQVHAFLVTDELAASWPELIESLSGLEIHARATAFADSGTCFSGKAIRDGVQVLIRVRPVPRVLETPERVAFWLLTVAECGFWRSTRLASRCLATEIETVLQAHSAKPIEGFV